MFLIHRGSGLLVLIAGVVAALVMNVITNALYDNNYYGVHVWPMFGTLWLWGLICIAVGAYFRKYPSKLKDNDWIKGESADHLFFIPIIYWGGVFFALGVVYVAYSFFNGSYTK